MKTKHETKANLCANTHPNKMNDGDDDGKVKRRRTSKAGTVDDAVEPVVAPSVDALDWKIERYIIFNFYYCGKK